MRTFIAFEIPEELRKRLGALQDDLRTAGGDVRWERPGNIHCTISFLGDVAAGLLPEVLSRTAAAAGSCRRFDVVVESLGCFPDARSPKVLWIGCRNDDGMLATLKRGLDAALAPLGFAPEERTFRPHLTLGRVKDHRNIRDLLSTMEKCTFEPHTLPVTELVVMKSVLGPQGAEYTVVQSTRLSA